MAVVSSAHPINYLFHHINGLKRFTFCLSFSFSATAASLSTKEKWRQPVASSVLELGGTKIAQDDVVRGDPTNNVADTIFSKLGMHLHRRNNLPHGILKNGKYEYFDTNYPNMFDKFDDLSPIVSIKQNFDNVLVPADHISKSYNDTYHVDSQTVLSCHTSSHQVELLRRGHTHFLIAGDVFYPLPCVSSGVRVFTLDNWEASSVDPTSYAAEDSKKSLEGLAHHLFGAVEMHWIDAYFPFTNPSYELEIYFKEKWMEVLGCRVMEQEILKSNGRLNSVAWAFGLGLERLAMVLFDIPDMSFWINESFTENNLCEVIRGIAGDLVEEVSSIDNFTNKKGMKSHCYRLAYQSMERSLTDEEINELQWNVREQVQNKLNVVLR